MVYEIVVFIAKADVLNDTAVFSGYYSQMPDYRKKKIDAIRYQKDKNLSLLAGILLKKACEYVGVPHADENVYYDDKGKPFFSESVGYYFSLSHSGDFAVCAVSQGLVGCDIEKTERRENLSKTVERFFDGDEKATFGKLGGKTETFYKLWTAKESLAKAIGCGLPGFIEKSEKEKYDFYEPDISGITTDYAISVCSETPSKQPIIKNVNI